MSGEVEKCPILHVCPKFDVFTLYDILILVVYKLHSYMDPCCIYVYVI